MRRVRWVHSYDTQIHVTQRSWLYVGCSKECQKKVWSHEGHKRVCQRYKAYMQSQQQKEEKHG